MGLKLGSSGTGTAVAPPKALAFGTVEKFNEKLCRNWVGGFCSITKSVNVRVQVPIRAAVVALPNWRAVRIVVPPSARYVPMYGHAEVGSLISRAARSSKIV